MSYKSKLKFLEDTSKDLNPEPVFYHGRGYEFESTEVKQTYVVWVRPMVKEYSKTTIGLNELTTVEIMFLKQTKMDMSDSDILQALDETGAMADEFVRLIHPWNFKHKEAHDNLYLASTEVNLLSASLVDPSINEFSKLLSGQFLTLTLDFKDDFNYCDDC